MVRTVITVALVIMVVIVIRTEETKLTSKLDFPGNLCGAAFIILAMFSIK